MFLSLFNPLVSPILLLHWELLVSILCPYLLCCIQRAQDLNLLLEPGTSHLLLADFLLHVVYLHF